MLLNLFPFSLLQHVPLLSPPPAPPAPPQMLTVPGHFEAIGFLKVHAVADSYLAPFKGSQLPFAQPLLQEIESLLPRMDEQTDLVLTVTQCRLLYSYTSYYLAHSAQDGEHYMAELYEELMDALLTTLMAFHHD